MWCVTAGKHAEAKTSAPFGHVKQAKKEHLHESAPQRPGSNAFCSTLSFSFSPQSVSAKSSIIVVPNQRSDVDPFELQVTRNSKLLLP
jgi:hypothetical protein